MHLSIQHRTRYEFSSPVRDVTQLLRLTPESCVSQTVLDWRIDVDCNAQLRDGRDGYGNLVDMLYVNEPVSRLVITAAGRVITEDRAGVVQGLPGELPPEAFLRPTQLTQPDDAIHGLAAELQERDENPLERLHALNTLIHGRMAFEVGSTDAATPAGAALAAGRGVCQDFAHIYIAVARLMGFSARYVSGHLYRGERIKQDAGHAWVEAQVPDLGWVAFDPANGICADDRYVRVAAGLDYADAAPVAGTRRGGGAEKMSVEIQVNEVKRRVQSQSQSQSGGGFQSQSQKQ